MAENQHGKGDSSRPAAETTTIVGIGASAGGVTALQTFFEALQEPIGVAFVVIVHLDPEAQSELPNIIAARTALAVTQVEGTVPLAPDHVYVIPPNRRLRISDNQISAITFDEPRGQRAPIDLFFRSLAEQHSNGFAIILTGAGSDGALGVRAVKEAGGIILVQEPDEAEYMSMPRSAIATGVADFVLPIRDIAAHLVELVRSKGQALPENLDESDEQNLRRIVELLHARTGHDFSKYKRSTLLRRITRRLQVTRKERLSDYFSYLRDNVEEAQALFSDLLISVTAFFRDPKAFESLAKRVIPQIFEAQEHGEALRVWVPGCATGEEAYAIGMLLLEEADQRSLRPEIQVFGSDLDAGALAVAREGRYPAAIEADISEERLRRFFAKEGDHYRVRQELRDAILFAGHSLLKDPPFSHLDLISCRNLLIYLDRELQQQACGIFHYALKPNGYLFLGSAETADAPRGQFRVIDRESRIYQAVGQTGRHSHAVPRLLGWSRIAERPPLPQRHTVRGPGWDSEIALHRQALEKTAPPSILVDEAFRAVHLSDNAGRFLQPPGGPLNSDISELVRPELRFDLRAALHRAFERGEATLSLPIFVRFDGLQYRVYLQVKPVEPAPEDRPRQVLVLFIQGEAAEQAAAEPATANEEQKASHDTIRQLREQLQDAQSRLKATREESESTNEELRAANEELQSINEEYRSTSEELETSKEELQSINEELQTVNSELKLRLESVSRANSDLQNLMAATDVATLFLDANLRIARFTPQVSDLFSIKLSDQGRPITDFAHQLAYDELAHDAQAVLETLQPLEREIETRGHNWYLMRMRPYRTIEDKIDGVVVTFVDITDRRRTIEALRVSEERLRQQLRFIEVSRTPFFVWDLDGVIVEWNRGAEILYGYARSEALGKNKEELLKTRVPGSSFAELKSKLLEAGEWSGELEHATKDGREVHVDSQIELSAMSGRRLVFESTWDITDRKSWEARQQLLLRELSHRVKNTLAVVQAIVRLSKQRRLTPKGFVAVLDGRLNALGRAHELLIDSDWKGTELEALARAQLKPYLTEDSQRVRISGEPVILPLELATPVGLVLHELCANSTKYGALSANKGVVELSWKKKNGTLSVVWRERHGPPVRKPRSRGFGSELIEKGIPNATVKRDFRRDGLVCRIDLPLEHST